MKERLRGISTVIIAFALVFAVCGCGAAPGHGGHASGDWDFADLTTESSDEFSTADECGFVSAAEESKSAFSLSVSSSSYTYMRRLVNSNSLPEQNSVRVEEYVNYFDYYVPIGSGEDFGAVTSVSDSPFGENEKLLRVTFRAKEYERESAPCNIVILADTSGSMYGADRLGLLKVAVEYLFDGMGNSDVISLVTYAGSNKIVFEGLGVNSRGEMLAAMENLKASGSTAGYDALTRAYEVASRHLIDGGNNRIVLFTDGDFNVGNYNEKSLLSAAEQYADGGIYLSCVGVGYGNYKDARMEKLANAGGGATYYLDGKSEAKRVFGEQLTGTLVTVACDAKAQVEFDPSAVDSYRRIGYDNRVLSGAQFDDPDTDAGEIGSSHTITALYQVRLKSDAYAGTEIAAATLRYRRPNEETERELKFAVTFGDGTRYDRDSEKIYDDDRFIACVAEFGLLLRGSRYKGGANFTDLVERLNALELADEYKTEFRTLAIEASRLHG